MICGAVKDSRKEGKTPTEVEPTQAFKAQEQKQKAKKQTAAATAKRPGKTAP